MNGTIETEVLERFLDAVNHKKAQSSFGGWGNIAGYILYQEEMALIENMKWIFTRPPVRIAMWERVNDTSFLEEISR